MNVLNGNKCYTGSSVDDLAIIAFQRPATPSSILAGIAVVLGFITN